MKDTSRHANTSRLKASANAHSPSGGLQERPIRTDGSDQHRDEHERNTAFERESECACNSVQVTSSELARQRTA